MVFLMCFVYLKPSNASETQDHWLSQFSLINKDKTLELRNALLRYLIWAKKHGNYSVCRATLQMPLFLLSMQKIIWLGCWRHWINVSLPQTLGRNNLKNCWTGIIRQSWSIKITSQGQKHWRKLAQWAILSLCLFPSL